MSEIMELKKFAYQLSEQEIARCMADFNANRDLQYTVGNAEPCIVIPAGPVPGVLASEIVEKKCGRIHTLTYGWIARDTVQLDEAKLRRKVREGVRFMLKIFADNPHPTLSEMRRKRILEWIWRCLKIGILDQATKAVRKCPAKAILSQSYSHRHVYNMPTRKTQS